MSKIECFIDKQSVLNQVLIEKLRKIIASISPQIEETFKYGTLFYLYKSSICYLSISKKDVLYIGFTKGYLMSDQHQVFDKPFDTMEVRKVLIFNLSPKFIDQIKDYFYESLLVNDELQKQKK